LLQTVGKDIETDDSIKIIHKNKFPDELIFIGDFDKSKFKERLNINYSNQGIFIETLPDFEILPSSNASKIHNVYSRLRAADF
jgi:hypothetical protein